MISTLLLLLTFQNQFEKRKEANQLLHSGVK